MLFTLEAVEAKHGDCLILHYGDPNEPRFIVIDGGPPTVYKNRLKPRLAGIRNRWHKDEALPIQMVIVSHIDSDHINGIVQWTNELVRESKKPDGVSSDILTLWHNSFDDISGNDQDGLIASVASQVSVSAAGVHLPPGVNIREDTALVLASVGEGRDLRDNATALDIPLNTGFKGQDTLKRLVTASETGKTTVDWCGLKLTVLGPQLAELRRLQEEWDKALEEMKRKNKGVDVAAYLDESVENLSSIVVLVEFRDGSTSKTMLLAGDARGDYIMKALESAGLMTNGKLHVDLLKMPHHGSVRDVDADFFQNVTADHYVISANGNYGNPDKETIELFSAARGDTDCTVWVTNAKSVSYKDLTDPDRLVKVFTADRDKGKKYRVVYRDEADVSVKVDLLDKVTY